MRRSRTVIATSAVLVTVASLLSIVGYVGITRLRHSIDRVNTASERLTAYQGVQRSLASEVFAEAAARRAPNPLAHERILAAQSELDAAVERVRRVGTTEDDVVLAALRSLNARYGQEVRRQLGPDGSSPLAVNDDLVAGPALDEMQGLIDSAVQRCDADLLAATAHQHQLINRMAWRAPLALLLSFGALALSWALLVLYGRRNARQAEESERLALRDPLTGLGNRRAFERLLDPELQRQDPDSAVLLIDLDGFKAINDTWGHDVGDDVLRSVAGRLVEAVRGTDYVTRIGGDEFAVLARPALQAEVLRERLQNAIARPLQLPDVLLQPSASIGWALVEPGSTKEDVLREADRGLYDHKRARSAAGPRIAEQRISGDSSLSPR
ncbi:MAG: diguanylate cyclase [Actinomycetota bacterium]|nr:diguanylate cyclase [Actinomycetota bacterium]